MKYATAKKISTQQCYNNEYAVLKIFNSFDSAWNDASDRSIIVEVSGDIKIGDSINSNGKKWESS
jgi:hypothetical protein